LATNARIEFVRLRAQDSNGLQNAYDVGDRAPVTKTLTGTALTGAGRVTVPASVNGYTRFHARINATVETIWSIAPAGDAGTSYDVTAALAGAISIPANTPTIIPVKPGQLLSGATGLTFA
jgi:hypothetical protein